MKNIGSKSVNMSDIMVYLAMFSTIIDKILCFFFGGEGSFGFQLLFMEKKMFFLLKKTANMVGMV